MVTRPVLGPARQGLTPLVGFLFSVLFCRVLSCSVMAQRVSRRTESLDVSEFAACNESKEVCQFIVEHFTHHNVHVVQLIGTFEKVTFAVLASKQVSNRSLVISRSTLMVFSVQCGRVVHVHKMSLYTITLSKVINSPSTGS